jgi:hypothetical protein
MVVIFCSRERGLQQWAAVLEILIPETPRSPARKEVCGGELETQMNYSLLVPLIVVQALKLLSLTAAVVVPRNSELELVPTG